MLRGFNPAAFTAYRIKDYIMATKAKAKAGRAAERNSSRSQSSNRNTQGASPSGLELLEQEHREVEECCDEYNELKEDDNRKGALAEKICLAVKVHAQIEEEIFYPQAREAIKDNDLIDEAAVEHATVKHLIGEIEGIEVDEELHDAKIRVLGEMVKHHIKERKRSFSRSSYPQKWILTRSARNLPNARKS